MMVESVNDAGIKKAHASTVGEDLGASEKDARTEGTNPLRQLHALVNGFVTAKGSEHITLEDVEGRAGS